MVERLRKAKSRLQSREQKAPVQPSPIVSSQAITPAVPLQPSEYVQPLADGKKRPLNEESTVISRQVPNDTMVTKESDARTMVTKEPDTRTMVTKDPNSRLTPNGDGTINWIKPESSTNKGVIPLKSMTPATLNEVRSSSSGKHSLLPSRVPEPPQSNRPSRCILFILSFPSALSFHH